ncbi:MAG: low molecular weight phosphatase family protein [Thermoplasmata archaeon]|nr:low molecular weight phosphatase family protein [Thermoplasmata archaeon]
MHRERMQGVLLLLLPVRLPRRPKPAKLLPERVNAERRVLFICGENAARSLMAEAIFHANPPAGWVADSAGTRPATHPNPRTERILHEIGLALPRHRLQELRPDQLPFAHVVVTMGCLDDASCPANLAAIRPRDWGLPDPAGLDDDGYRADRDSIRARAGALRAELGSRDSSRNSWGPASSWGSERGRWWRRWESGPPGFPSSQSRGSSP